MPVKPEDIYGVAKAAVEKSTEILADVHGFDYTIIRPHNVYGPRQALWDPYRNVVAIFINRLMKNLPLVIYVTKLVAPYVLALCYELLVGVVTEPPDVVSCPRIIPATTALRQSWHVL